MTRISLSRFSLGNLLISQHSRFKMAFHRKWYKEGIRIGQIVGIGTRLCRTFRQAKALAAFLQPFLKIRHGSQTPDELIDSYSRGCAVIPALDFDGDLLLL